MLDLVLVCKLQLQLHMKLKSGCPLCIIHINSMYDSGLSSSQYKKTPLLTVAVHVSTIAYVQAYMLYSMENVKSFFLILPNRCNKDQTQEDETV